MIEFVFAFYGPANVPPARECTAKQLINEVDQISHIEDVWQLISKS
jgi:hypothetical protein